LIALSKFVFGSTIPKINKAAIIGIAGIATSLFFLGSNVTGNAIGSLSKSSGSWIGIVLLAIGLISGFFWMKNRKK